MNKKRKQFEEICQQTIDNLPKDYGCKELFIA